MNKKPNDMKDKNSSSQNDLVNDGLSTQDLFVWLCAIGLTALALIIDHHSPLMAILFAACAFVFAVYGIISFFKKP